MLLRKPRPCHIIFLAGTLLFCAFLILSSSAVRSVHAGFDYGWICDPEEYDCWETNDCEPEYTQRTESYPARYCVFTGNYAQYCFYTSWSCFDLYSCPSETYMGTFYQDGLCGDI